MSPCVTHEQQSGEAHDDHQLLAAYHILHYYYITEWRLSHTRNSATKCGKSQLQRQAVHVSHINLNFIQQDVQTHQVHLRKLKHEYNWCITLRSLQNLCNVEEKEERLAGVRFGLKQRTWFQMEPKSAERGGGGRKHEIGQRIIFATPASLLAKSFHMQMVECL